ncbi:MAG: hypothetical protein KKA73_26850 [Chloroflexi bacterium]|nr:hypothetical protein [Chloroflexota bacterium]MBU1751319.1 hypothetical protein [Chloroflexota bacterium]
MLLERKQLRREYGKLFDEVSAILFKSDPIGINLGINTDEYESEVSTILPRLKSCHSVEEARSVIHQEFTYWFGREDAGPETRYQQIAESIWVAWQHDQRRARA